MQKPDPQFLQSEETFRLLVDSVRDYAIFILTPEGEIATWNPGAERIKGYEPAEIIGRHFSVFYTEEDKKARKPENELITAKDEGRYEDEGWRVRKDGTRFWANVIIVALRNEQGQFLGFGKITRDLTRRREEELRYRRLVEGVKDYAIYSLDVNGNVTSWNVGAERIKQYKESEIIGQNFSRFYTDDDISKGVPQRNLRVAAEKGQVEDEGWRIRKNGTKFWCSVVITAIHDDEGGLLGFTKITRDITDRKLLLDQVQQHAKDLEARIEERDKMYADLEAFSYSISHDLRAPLRAIEGFTEALKEDMPETPNAEVTADLAQIMSATERMSHLIEDLLEYSRLGRSPMAATVVPIEDLVAEVLQNEAGGGAAIRTVIEPRLKVLAHKPALVQALVNLVENAVKFHKPESPADVTITASRKNRNVRIAVSDHGIGIAPQHHERIFQVFQRLHASDVYPGTGIGLALVKRIAERLGGTMGLESEFGKGSTFWIEIPSA